jgi:polyhydroxyalkanoate synthase
MTGSTDAMPNAFEECPAETLRTIYELMRQLFDIYSKESPELVPSDLTQLSHIFTLLSYTIQHGKIDPKKMGIIQHDCVKDLLRAFNDFEVRIITLREHEDVFKSFKNDKQFASSVWKNNPYFELIRRLYYLTRKYSLRILYSIDHIDNRTKQQLHFYIINYLNLLSPTNYMWINPEVIQSTIHSGGNNLLRGFKNYLEDLVLNAGKLNVRMTDVKAYKVGENLAITEGKVIYQNDLMQLIQYEAKTPNVYKTPILIVPPWINKYYVLDLSPNNSLIKWLVEQGFTVFTISWINPGPELANKEFADYMLEGPIQAVDVITKETKVDSVHMVGYCIGGTLLACTLAYMEANNDKRAKSSTFFMSLVNFSNPGEIGVFLDEPQLDALEDVMKKRGYLNGRLLDIAFNTLRPNELIWPYFINSYLHGNPAKPFDILYWNADSSNLPYKMYNFYLRNMYLHNKLREPGGIVLNNTPIDLSNITTPSIFVAAEGDHITLWRAIYSGLHYIGGPVEFILSESGHVRAVVNPTTSTKYGFKTNDKFNKPEDFKNNSKEWLETAINHTGTWWIYWVDWLKKQDSTEIPARKINPAIVIEDAPGSYVRKRI